MPAEESMPAELLVHPLSRAWVSTGGTGAQNYDEFADEAEIEAILADRPASILAVDMPHCTPTDRAAHATFADALPEAAARLTALESDGHFLPAQDVAVAYRISTEAGPSYGLLAMVDTDQISADVDQPGRVIRNEEVFLDKVRERMALTDALGQLLSAVLLVQPDRGAELQRALQSLVDGAGEADVRDIDQLGQTHEMWLLPESPARAELLRLAGDGDLVVADGNHRSLAAQEGGLARFLAVVTTPESVRLRPYNRLVRSVSSWETALNVLRSAGCTVTEVEQLQQPDQAGTVGLYADGQAYDVTLPEVLDARPVDRLDHTVVERLLIVGALGLDPAGLDVSYIGGDYPAQWLQGQVDDGSATLAVLIAPVTVEEFLAVNLARETMPRKSTWFVPKARTGLVLAEL